jgi:hypothetical protein
MLQDIFAVDLVVEQIEAEVRLLLRLSIQLSLKRPDRNLFPGSSPITRPLLLQKLVQSKDPSLHRRYPASLAHLTLSDSQTGRRLFYDVGGATSTHPGLPQLPRSPSLHAVLNTPVDWIRCTCWSLPCPFGLPRLIGGSASTTKLSTCSSFTRVTACRAARPPYVGFVTRLHRSRFPSSNAR